MKMTRNLIILGIVVVLVVAFVVGVSSMKPAATASPSPTTDPQLIISALTVDDISEVTVDNLQQQFTLYKSADKYAVKGQEGIVLEQYYAKNVFMAVASITGLEMIEQDPKDLSIYGLSKPQAKATAKYKDGTTAVFLLGNKAATGSYYFMKQGDTKVVTVGSSIFNAYLGTVETLLSTERLHLSPDDEANVNYIKVVKKGVTTLEVTQDSAFSKLSMLCPFAIVQPWNLQANSTDVATFLEAVLAVSMRDAVENNPKDLTKYGLDNPAYDITIRSTDLADELLIGSDMDDTYAYGMFAGGRAVYKIDKSTLAFMKTTAYMLKNSLLALVDIQSVSSVDFQGLGQQGSISVVQKPTLDADGNLKKDGYGNQVYDQIYSIGGKSVEPDVARTYYRDCISLPIHSMVDEGWQPSGDPLAVLTFSRINYPTELKIEFLPYDKDYYAIRIGGETVFLIEQEKVQKVAEDLGQLENGTLAVVK
jgi:hypothetical protein